MESLRLDSKAAIVSLIVGAIGMAFALIAPYAVWSSRPKNYPPGPTPVPILGNLNIIPPSKSFILFHEWGKKYGPILGLKFGPANVVVLNNYKDTQALLESRSQIYSSRPENYIANHLICTGYTHILFAPYGPQWKALRKAVQALFSSQNLANTLSIQNAEATQVLYDILRDPSNYYKHIQRYTTAVILATVFGQRGEKFDSPKIQALYDVQNRFTSLLEVGAAPPVDGLAFLRHWPEFCAPWKKRAKQIRRDQRKLYFQLLDETKEGMRKGTSTNCFMEQLIHNQENSGLNDERVAYVGGILMEAGSDTTSSTLLSFLLGILQNQDALRKAQEDVDRVCGVERSPSPNDIMSLPYIEACMNEVLRWRPVAAGGIPHMLTQQDTYKGYVFPKGTIFLANAWAIHHDENEYERPHEFIPDRWLKSKFGTKHRDSEGQTLGQRKLTYSWGAGRRICSGQKLAENSLRLGIAKLVWAFDISPVPGAEVDVDPISAYYGGFLICPKKFPVRIMPRSEKHASVIEREIVELAAVFDKFVPV